MRIRLESITEEFVRLTALDPTPLAWGRIRGFFQNSWPAGPDSIRIAFHEFVHYRPNLIDYCEANEIPADEDEGIANRIRRFEKAKSTGLNLSEADLDGKLKAAGFSRTLLPFQMRNVLRLVQHMQGASFSVPGAGKTTEALAFFFAIREAGDPLFVVAPKNAFAAWEEQLDECVPNCNRRFVRLTGGEENAKRLLNEGHDFFLITYQSLGKYQKPIGDFLARRDNAFVFLDESHRAKNPQSQTAAAIRRISVLPKAKLLLSGTPMPQSPRDLVPQVQFLFPDEDILEEEAVERIQKVYVRTTATELGIPDIHYERRNIALAPIEQEAYNRMRALSAAANANPNPKDARYLRQLGKSVIRLLSFVANPATLAPELSRIDSRLMLYLCSHDGQKIAYVCNRARELVAQGKKVLIWSSFIKNVELIATRLADLGADFIHGGVQAGDEEDDGTREQKIARFHADPHAMVLVANPAAASEGISLHKVCQHAIYLDRSFNAAHFLQSQDRIHRIGMPPGTVPTVEIVQCPGTIDEVADLRLAAKIEAMASVLNDHSIVPCKDLVEESDESCEEESAGLSEEDCDSILKHLQSL